MLRAAVHTADAAGCEYFDTRHGRQHHGGGHRRCTRLFSSNYKRHIAAADFDGLLTELAKHLNIWRAKAYLQMPVHDGNGCGHRTVGADFRFYPQRSLHILRIGHAVRDDRGLQRHYWLACA